jgi:hypothetical protein
MKLLKASIIVIGITLCVAACKKTESQNTATDNTITATAPAPAAPEMNAAAANNMAAPDNAIGNGDRTDDGPRR